MSNERVGNAPNIGKRNASRRSRTLSIDVNVKLPGFTDSEVLPATSSYDAD